MSTLDVQYANIEHGDLFSYSSVLCFLFRDPLWRNCAVEQQGIGSLRTDYLFGDDDFYLMTSSPGSASRTIWLDDWREVTSSYRVGASVGRNYICFVRETLICEDISSRERFQLKRDEKLHCLFIQKKIYKGQGFFSYWDYERLKLDELSNAEWNAEFRKKKFKIKFFTMKWLK